MRSPVQLQAAAGRLGAEEQAMLFGQLKERLGADFSKGDPWDKPNAPGGTLRRDGWRLIAEYVRDRACVMFTSDCSEAWEVASGPSLLKLLEQGPALEFYVCDSAASYLICHNHHDVVVGWGQASNIGTA